MFDNWFRHYIPKKSIIICTPYIKKNAFTSILDLYNYKTDISSLDIKILIRGNEEEFTISKSSDISILDYVLSLRHFDINNFRRISNLHMKAYLIDYQHLLITSGNLTPSGMFVKTKTENYEAGIATDSAEIIKSFCGYFNSIWNESECLNTFYDKIISAYDSYIKNDYSDENTGKRVLEKHNFSYVSNNSSGNVSINELDSISLSDLPPVSSFEYLDTTVSHLEKLGNVTYDELGKDLRRITGKDNLDSIVANKKFGEEKGKFAVFFGLASVCADNNENEFRITGLGLKYNAMSINEKQRLIKDMFFSKFIIALILQNAKTNTSFNLRTFIYSICPKSRHSTLNRRISTLNSMFAYIKELVDDKDTIALLNHIMS